MNNRFRNRFDGPSRETSFQQQGQHRPHNPRNGFRNSQAPTSNAANARRIRTQIFRATPNVIQDTPNVEER